MMPKQFDLESERDLVDLVTNAMFSISFLDSISKVIFSPKRNLHTVGHFFDSWLALTGKKDAFVPLSLGILTGYLFVGISLTKEAWFDLLPDINLIDGESQLGFQVSKVTDSKRAGEQLELRRFARRLRNSISHASVKYQIPDEVTPADIFDKTIVKFHDVNMRDKTDTFDAEITLTNLFKFIKAYHAIIHKHVREKQHG